MLPVICFGVMYLYLQFAISFNSKTLIKWDDPTWMPDSFATRKKKSRAVFAMGWIIITLFTFFLDTGILFYGFPIWLEYDHWDKVKLLPFLLIPLILTFSKAQIIHMFWLSWRLDRLKGRDVERIK
ncbi:MAG: hypothetical protein WCK01_02515 [Candidatus Uhrbacteria bacterium]